MINLRNAMMVDTGLPYDAEVEFLESTGTQWIDTGFIPSSNTSVEISYKTADAQLNTVLFGRRVTYSDRSFCVWANVSGKIRFDYSANSVDNKDGPNSIAGSWVQIAKRKERNFVNGTEYTANATKTFACNGNAYLFGMNDNGTANWLISALVAYCRIYENDTLVRDFIPVRKGTVGYLYDRVSGKLFGNAGTGDFVLGPDVVPVEYIESHGTEYIDTGIKLRSTDTIDTRFYINSSATASWYGILGSRDSDRYLIFRCFANNDSLVNTLAPNRNFSFTRFSWGNFSFAFGGDYHESATNCYLFTYNNNGTPYPRLPYRFANFSITRDGSKLINFLPVRVGTGSTWKGAMMDVLTRRIYRNAGTGAFTYGNDLKYPIPAE